MKDLEFQHKIRNMIELTADDLPDKEDEGRIRSHCAYFLEIICKAFTAPRTFSQPTTTWDPSTILLLHPNGIVHDPRFGGPLIAFNDGVGGFCKQKTKNFVKTEIISFFKNQHPCVALSFDVFHFHTSLAKFFSLILTQISSVDLRSKS